ncbi:hypothetical protein GCM10008085_10900 [Winogradskyella epiphytica]|nr:hypothetical protein GCM10008085_10900 [Winogradskyella epiphytica]
MLYKIMITAITSKMWIKLLDPNPGTIPNNPNNHTMIAITATSQRIFFIMFKVFVVNTYKV